MRRENKNSCDVCFGLGTYPVINRLGEDLYSIPCPECRTEDLALLAVTNRLDSGDDAIVRLRSRRRGPEA